MRRLTDVVREALDSNLEPDEINQLCRTPEALVARLSEAYTRARPDPPSPRMGTITRPYWIYGAESRGSSVISAPVTRVEHALQLLVYHHEVCIADPVDWYLHHPFGKHFHTEEGAQQLLHSIVQVTELIDASVVHVLPQEFGDDKERSRVAAFLAKRAFGGATGPDIDNAADVLQQVEARRTLSGAVDVYATRGHQLHKTLLALLTEAGLATSARYVTPVQAVVVVPDTSRVTNRDLISLRQSSAFADWQSELSRAVAAFEHVLADPDSSADAAREAFLDHLAGPASGLRIEVESSPLGQALRSAGRDFVLGAAGALAVLHWGWEAVLAELAADAGVNSARMVPLTLQASAEARLQRPLLRHYDTFLAS